MRMGSSKIHQEYARKIHSLLVPGMKPQVSTIGERNFKQNLNRNLNMSRDEGSEQACWAL